MLSKKKSEMSTSVALTPHFPILLYILKILQRDLVIFIKKILMFDSIFGYME